MPASVAKMDQPDKPEPRVIRWADPRPFMQTEPVQRLAQAICDAESDLHGEPRFFLAHLHDTQRAEYLRRALMAIREGDPIFRLHGIDRATEAVGDRVLAGRAVSVYRAILQGVTGERL